MSVVVAIVAAWLVTWALHGLVLLVVTAGLTRVVRRPAVRELVWKAAFVGALGTATLQIGFGVGVGPVLEFTVDEPSSERAAATSPAASMGTPAARDETLVGVAPLLAVAEPLAESRSRTLAEPALPAASVSSAPGTSWLPAGVVGIASLFASLGVLRLLAVRRRLRHLLRDRVAIADGALRNVFDVLAARLAPASRRTIRLSRSPTLEVPIAFGVLRREVCVPDRIAFDPDPTRWRAVLAHELAHHARRDPLWLHVLDAVRALFPWHPLVRAARRHVAVIAEDRCDGMAAALVDPVDVARCLVDVASWLRDDRSPSVAAAAIGMATRGSGLRRRVDRLLDGAALSELTVAPRWTRAAVVLTVSATGFVLPGVAAATTEPGPAPATVPVVRGPEATPPPAPRDVEDVPASDPSAGRDPIAEALRDLTALLDEEVALLTDEVSALAAETAADDDDAQVLLRELRERLDRVESRRVAIRDAVRSLTTPR